MSAIDFETYGVPTFYCNITVSEPAGGGNVRIWNCIRRHGVLIPVCEIIIPAADLVIAAKAVTETALLAFNTEQLFAMIH